LNTPNKAVVINNQTSLKFDEDLFEIVIKVICKKENLTEDTFVNLLLSDNGSIQDFNRQYLGRDELTDIISFGVNMPSIPILGDIIIDTNVADAQKDNRTLEEEMQILFLHGVLHLLSYDHLSASDEKIMSAKEEEYKLYIIEMNKSIFKTKNGDYKTSER
jgi:probable rRNA maturation factor